MCGRILGNQVKHQGTGPLTSPSRFAPCWQCAITTAGLRSLQPKRCSRRTGGATQDWRLLMGRVRVGLKGRRAVRVADGSQRHGGAMWRWAQARKRSFSASGTSAGSLIRDRGTRTRRQDLTHVSRIAHYGSAICPMPRMKLAAQWLTCRVRYRS